MIDLTKKIGFKVLFDEKTNKFEFGSDVTFKRAWEKSLTTTTAENQPLWKSLMLAKDFTDLNGNIIKQPNLEKFNQNEKYYFGFNSLYLENYQEEIKNKNLMPDLTIILPGTMNNEYNRTEGHEHLSQLPEVYENIYGKSIYLIFKLKENKIDVEDIIAIFADVGDHVIFPPGYHHISINISETPFIMTDWNSTNANSNFMFIKNHNGAPYWVIKGKKGQQFIKNPKYAGIVPKIRKVKPAEEILEFGLKKGEPMFNLVKDNKIKLLDFMNDNTGRYESVFKRVFVEI
jgi:oxalate decarboxylase/phosphoglucose isomerase-like protein (cupin superfamily)